MNRGRFRAQGNNLEKSEPWATLDDINKVVGNQLINHSKLTPSADFGLTPIYPRLQLIRKLFKIGEEGAK